jgi:predicted MFS family arabinose efflux permease
VISWGILYYAFGILAPAIRVDLGLSVEKVYGAFSWAVLVAGLASIPVGALIDRHGGSRVMAAGSFLAGAGLCILAGSRGLAAYYFAWTIIGIGMAMSLYEAAFATLNRSLHEASRKAISNVTLFGGLASTAFWPLTAWLLGRLDWRQTCLAFAATLLLICVPLHAVLDDGKALRANVSQSSERRHFALAEAVTHPAFWLLATVFAAQAFIFSALSVHMIPLLGKMGYPEQLAIGMVALIGPMQVVGRLTERVLADLVSPRTVGVFTIAGLPVAIGLLYALGGSGWAVVLFCILYGMSNGVLTILRGTLPQSIFGHANYGAISGALAAPSLIAKSGAPLLIASMLSEYDYHVLLGGLLGLALIALVLYLLTLGRDGRAARSVVAQPISDAMDVMDPNEARTRCEPRCLVTQAPPTEQ